MSESEANAVATDPRDRIVEVAIQLFAERGFEGTSIRDITAEASCGVAAVNYYFGGKEKLYEAALRALACEVQQHRMAAIRASMVDGSAMSLESFLHIFATSFLEPMVSGRGALFMALMAREMGDQRMSPEIFINEFIRPFTELSSEALGCFGPPMDERDTLMCLMSLVGQLIHLIRVIRIGEHEGLDIPVASFDEYVEHIVRFSAAGIRACAEPASRRPSLQGLEA